MTAHEQAGYGYAGMVSKKPIYVTCRCGWMSPGTNSYTMADLMFAGHVRQNVAPIGDAK